MAKHEVKMKMRTTILVLVGIVFAQSAFAEKYADLPGLGESARIGADIIDRAYKIKYSERNDSLTHALNLIREEASEGSASANYLLGVIYTQESSRYCLYYDILLDKYYHINDIPLVGMEDLPLTEGIDMFEKTSYTEYCQDNGITYYKRAVERDYLPAINNLAHLYSSPDSYFYQPELALSYFNRLANKGYPSACASLGLQYFYGGNLVDSDFVKAVELLGKAVANGDKNDETFLCLGYCYETGCGVQQNYRKAVEIYNQAPDYSSLVNALGGMVGNFSIPSRLAILYYSVDEVRDYNLAYKYLSAVANQNVREVGEVRGYILRCLSACYRFGRGTEVDIEKADYYLKEAGDFGNIDAQTALKMLSIR